MTTEQTVFVVEDDARMCAAIELLLRTGGYKVRSYPNAEAMLADQKGVQPICLLTDIRLPGMDGLVARFIHCEGYRLLSLTRASSVVKRQSATACWAFRLATQAVTSSAIVCLSGMR